MSQPVQHDVHLDFTMAKQGARLRIDYTLTNGTADSIFVADQLLTYFGNQIRLAPDRMIVVAGAPGVVRFVRGLVKTQTTQFDHPPGAVLVKPGETHTGSAELDLPLTGWHNYDPPPALPADPKSAVLEIAYLTGDGILWGKVTTADGKDVTVPQMPSYNEHAKVVSAGPKPLP